MNTIRNGCFTLLAVIALHPLVMSQTVAQQETSELSMPLPAGAGAAPADGSGPPDDQWHIEFFPCLWFSGMHGTMGVLGFNASGKASAGDLLSHFDLGLMNTLEARKQRVVLQIDLMWMALSDDKGVPTNEADIESISSRVGQFILTPKAGSEIIDTNKLKVDSWWVCGTGTLERDSTAIRFFSTYTLKDTGRPRDSTNALMASSPENVAEFSTSKGMRS